MKIKRRSFIKRSLGLAAGLVFMPPVFIRKLNTFGKVNLIPPSIKPSPEDWKDNEINIAWIGHSTVLINFFGTIILTDPILYERIGLYFLGLTYGPSRYSAPALELHEIPQPDLVLLSHAHMDHMDYKTLSVLAEKFPNKIECVTAYNTMDVINNLPWKSLQEMDWGNNLNILDLNITALEVKHFGWRFPWERDRSKGFMKNGRSFNSYILEKNGTKILFGGDTAYSDKFCLSDELDLDIAIMPIGAYNPWKVNHCTPEEALIMASDHLNAEYFIPIHCGTFKQGLEPVDEPLRWLNKSSKNYDIKIGLKNIGETFTLKS